MQQISWMPISLLIYTKKHEGKGFEGIYHNKNQRNVLLEVFKKYEDISGEQIQI